MNTRLAVFIGLMLLAVLGPWWLVCALLVGAILFYQDFFEGLIVLLYIDLVFGTGLDDWRGYFVFTLSGLIFLLAVEVGRKAMLVHH